MVCSLDEIEVIFPHAVSCKIDPQTGEIKIGHLEVRNKGSETLTGCSGEIAIQRGDVGNTESLLKGIPIPALYAKQEVTIFGGIAPLYKDIQISKDPWRVRYFIRAEDGEKEIFRTSLTFMSDELEEKLNHLNDLEEEMRGLRVQYAKDQKTIGALTDELENTERQRDDIKKQLEASQKETAGKVQTILELDKKVKELTTQLDNAKEYSVELEGKIAKLEDDKKQLERLISSFSEQIKSTQEENEQFRVEIKELKQSLDEKEETISALQAETRKTEQQLDETKKQLQLSQRETEQEKQRRLKSSIRVDELQKSLGEKEEALKRLTTPSDDELRTALDGAVKSKTPEPIALKPIPVTPSLHFMPIDVSGKPIHREGDRKIYVKQPVYRSLKQHVDSDENKVGGFLLGEVYHNEATETDFITIDSHLSAKHTESTGGELRFTSKTFLTLHQEHQAQLPNKKVVGWYHSHPGLGIFLSDKDLFIHENFFKEPYQVAFVIDPKKNQGGFFQWEGGTIDPLNPTGFYEILDIRDESQITWNNVTNVN